LPRVGPRDMRAMKFCRQGKSIVRLFFLTQEIYRRHEDNLGTHGIFFNGIFIFVQSSYIPSHIFILACYQKQNI